MVKKNTEFEHLLLDYLDLFDLKDYMELADENSDSDPAFSLFYMVNRDFLGFDFAAQLRQDFEDIGMDSGSFLGMLDGYEQSMRRFVIELCRQLSRRNQLEKTETQVQSRPDVISDSLLDFLICGIVESISFHDWKTPNAFFVLLLARHNVPNGAIISRFRKTLKQNAVITIWGRYPDASLSQVAEKAELNKSTLSRWLTDDEKFKETLEWRLGFDEKKFFELIELKLSGNKAE